LSELKQAGYRLVGLEQTTNSRSLYEYRFPHRMVFVLGHERLGITADILPLLDDVVEIPVYGLPYSYNVVTAATMAMYEYCRQFPQG
jgi:tRNA G18 (ribose-2'-O)-methylase SpoU